MAPNIAFIEHPVTKHCPILTAGDVSPKALVDLVDAHNEYFIAKDIDDDDKVKKILGSFKDVHIWDWISSDHKCLLKLKYSVFMEELRLNYLPADWEDNIHTEILGMKMDKNVKFWDWCQEIRTLNIVLRGTESHLNDATLRNQLEAALEPSLRLYCSHLKLRKVTVLKDWITAVKEADEKLNNDHKRSREIFKEEAECCAAKRPALSNHSRAGNTEAWALSSGNTDSGHTKRCPKLEPDEWKLLIQHNGCFKCRCFDQSHGANNCPHGFPDGKSYRKVTATCDCAGNPPKKNGKPFTSGKGKAVAAVTNEDMVSVSEDEEECIAAVMPSAVLGNGSFSESDVSPPLQSKHFVAKFNIFAGHLDFPLTFPSLVDNGAHVVLIRPNIVDQLRLQRHPLKTPEIVSVAIEDGKKKKKMKLYHYVKFAVTPTDNVWTSKVIHAIVAPGLCMPLILGLPFLIHNNIVTDHAQWSCIDKMTGYNIMNPSLVKPPPPPRKRLKEQIKDAKATKKLVLAELGAVC